MSIVLSIGYEQRNVTEFIDLMKEYLVEEVLDVRQIPNSRKPGFSKKKLQNSLNQVGIEYVHIPLAGNPYHKEKKDLTRCLQLYRCYLEANPEIVTLVEKQSTGKTVAILCYERKHENCHRSILLEFTMSHSNSIQLIKLE